MLPAPGPTSAGLTAIDRSDASSGAIYRDGVEIGTNAIASPSVALTGERFFALAYNNGGAPGLVDTARRVAAVFWGGHLSAAEHLALHDRLRGYLAAIGAA